MPTKIAPSSVVSASQQRDGFAFDDRLFTHPQRRAAREQEDRVDARSTAAATGKDGAVFLPECIHSGW